LALAHYNVGNALSAQRKYGEAEAAYGKAIALKPDYAEAYCNLGAALNDPQRHGEAEAALRKAIDLKPDVANAYNNLGVTLFDQGRHGEAEAAFRRAIGLKPDDAEAYSNLGNALSAQQTYGQAEAAYGRAIARSGKRPVLTVAGLVVADPAKAEPRPRALSCLARGQAARRAAAEGPGGQVLQKHVWPPSQAAR
jgi:tetratricopeptide (TPR) repeat protein